MFGNVLQVLEMSEDWLDMSWRCGVCSGDVLDYLDMCWRCLDIGCVLDMLGYV